MSTPSNAPRARFWPATEHRPHGLAAGPAAGSVSARRLRLAAASWVGVALVGQWLFAAYVMLAYGLPALQGQWQHWNKLLPRGIVASDLAGNLVVAVHLLFTVLIVGCATLQLWPALRRRAPAWHRASGRVYLLAAAVLSLGGLWMVWTRGSVGDLSQHIAISLNAVIILACGAMALRHAIARRTEVHRRWALRLFLAVSGVWLFRITLMLWIIVNQGPAGFDPKTFSGPALTVIAFAVYVVVPLAVLQWLLHVQQRGTALAQTLLTVVLALLSLLTAAAVAATAALMWWPRVSAALTV